MHGELLIGISIVTVLSIGAQWLAWRIKLPSILLLLLAGILAGPVTHVVHVDELFGELLFPVISLSVAIILFEGGLSLRLEDLQEIGSVVRNLITIGAIVSWLLMTLAAHFVLDVSWSVSFLVGSILVVTGPTVVTPLLNQIRPSPRISSILRWEGIMIDPVGAVLTVLVFEEVIVAGPQFGITAVGIVRTLFVGIVFGGFIANALVEAFRRYWVPDNLQNPVVIMMLVAGFTLSNEFQPESGLLTVTVMGIAMANQRRFDVQHIVEFKENLQVLLISTIFILLGARLELEPLADLGTGVFLFLGLLMLVIRPIVAWISTIGADLMWQERVFIAWMAPRGIVAASVASVFSVELANEGIEDANVLVPVTFAVIIASVTIYGLTSGPVARMLGLVQQHPRGVLFIGAHSWARRLALAIKGIGYRVIMIDTNVKNIDRALAAGLEGRHGNVLNESLLDELELGGIGSVIAMTPNDEVNSLASLQFKDIVGQEYVFQLPRQRTQIQTKNIAFKLGGRNLFGSGVTFDFLSNRFNAGARLEFISVNNVRNVTDLFEDVLTPLFIITDSNDLIICTEDNSPAIQIGQRLLCVVEPNSEEKLKAVNIEFKPV